jgi:hypothetical protein
VFKAVPVAAVPAATAPGGVGRDPVDTGRAGLAFRLGPNTRRVRLIIEP